MTFPARFPGTCAECGARFHVNDPIRRADDDDGWAHDACAEPPHQDREPCPTCWLTICDCEDER